jgi:aryl-alcohol dehydrogenase-like predicted oxidoreductase
VTFNVTTLDGGSTLERCKTMGWETFATSPFVRGWELDRMIQQASVLGYGEGEALRPTLADLMLRYALFHPHVDRVIVAMRRVAWIACNIESVRRGPLTSKERIWLQRLRPTH